MLALPYIAFEVLYADLVVYPASLYKGNIVSYPSYPGPQQPNPQRASALHPA